MKVGLMFSGQGAQYPNMCIDFITEDLVNIFKKVYNYDPVEALKNNNDELFETLYVQPLMILCEIAILEKFKKDFKFDGVLGFSLGEFSAYYASGVFSLEDIFEIVKYRGIYMQEAANETKGSMAAVLNMNPEKIQEIIDKNKFNVEIANYNSKSQIVISGNACCIEKITPVLLEQGAKRVIKLNVAGAFHSKHMEKAGEKLFSELNKYKTNNTTVPMYLNTTAKPLSGMSDVFSQIRKQISSGVLFYQSIENMIDDGFDCFIEIGPGKVLSTLVKKNYEISVFNVGNINDLENLKGVL